MKKKTTTTLQHISALSQQTQLFQQPHLSPLCVNSFPQNSLGQTNHTGQCTSGQFEVKFFSAKTEVILVNWMTEVVDKINVQVWLFNAEHFYQK